MNSASPLSTADHAADLSNWRVSPHSKWSFRNVEQIVPVATIANAPETAIPMKCEPKSLEEFKLADSDGSAMDIEAFEAATSSDALVAVIGDNLVYESYRNGMTPDTRHILMSATKAVTGLLAGILQGQGAIDVSKAVSEYVPEVARTGYEGATLRHLLDMRTGVILDSEQQRAYANASNWEPLAPGEAGLGFCAFLESLPESGASHGGPFRYISANTDLLGLAFERATGQKFATLVSDLIWKPMGAEHNACITLTRDETPRSTGGLCATARDFARIGRMMIQNGRSGPRQVVPAAWVKDIMENGDSSAWAQGEWGQAFAALGKMNYRSGWYIVENNPKTFFAMGIHGQNLFVDRTLDFVVAKFSSQPNPIESVALTHRGVAEMRRCLTER